MYIVYVPTANGIPYRVLLIPHMYMYIQCTSDFIIRTKHHSHNYGTFPLPLHTHVHVHVVNANWGKHVAIEVTKEM